MSKSKNWMRAHVNDPYVKQAQAKGYRSRAAFKLLEIAEKDRLISAGDCVVDLGAAPGSWSQVIAAKAGPRGKVVAVDLLEMAPIPGVYFIQGDFREQAVLAMLEELLEGRQVDLVVSDMSPNLSGVAASDQARSSHLCELALEFSCKHLKLNGNFLVKAFQGSSFPEFQLAMREHFHELVTRKPSASKGRSSEIYLLGKRRR